MRHTPLNLMAICTAAAVLLACMLYVSVVPLVTLPAVFSMGWDKGQHIVGFAVLAVAGFVFAPGRRVQVAIGLLAWGAIIELAQAATGWRHGEWADWLADALGIALALLLVLGVQKWLVMHR